MGESSASEFPVPTVTKQCGQIESMLPSAFFRYSNGSSGDIAKAPRRGVSNAKASLLAIGGAAGIVPGVPLSRRRMKRAVRQRVTVAADGGYRVGDRNPNVAGAPPQVASFEMSWDRRSRPSCEVFSGILTVLCSVPGRHRLVVTLARVALQPEGNS
jgi:hypothetical protein